MRRGRRYLTVEESALWEAVAESVTPRRSRHAVASGAANPAAEPDRAPPVTLPSVDLSALKVSARAPKEPPIRIDPRPPQHGAAVHMDAKAYGRMRRGRLAPEARLDLHGMTVNEAHAELAAFLLWAHRKDLRLVLVITGKGRDSDGGKGASSRSGVLRQQVPQWLRLPPFGPLILQVADAHLSHGGAGALYVYLRRRG